jgi:hypothetical protein
MSNESQGQNQDWRRPQSPAAALRAAFAGVTRRDDASASATGQREASTATALFCLPTLDWPPNLFA